MHIADRREWSEKLKKFCMEGANKCRREQKWANERKNNCESERTSVQCMCNSLSQVRLSGFEELTKKSHTHTHTNTHSHFIHQPKPAMNSKFVNFFVLQLMKSLLLLLFSSPFHFSLFFYTCSLHSCHRAAVELFVNGKRVPMSTIRIGFDAYITIIVYS